MVCVHWHTQAKVATLNRYFPASHLLQRIISDSSMLGSSPYAEHAFGKVEEAIHVCQPQACVAELTAMVLGLPHACILLVAPNRCKMAARTHVTTFAEADRIRH